MDNAYILKQSEDGSGWTFTSPDGDVSETYDTHLECIDEIAEVSLRRDDGADLYLLRDGEFERAEGWDPEEYQLSRSEGHLSDSYDDEDEAEEDEDDEDEDGDDESEGRYASSRRRRRRRSRPSRNGRRGRGVRESRTGTRSRRRARGGRGMGISFSEFFRSAGHVKDNIEQMLRAKSFK